MTEPITHITPTRTSFLRSLQIQGRVIWALVMREIITRYGRHNIGFMWLFVEPMMFTAGITVLWTLARSTHGSNLPIVPFAVTGYSCILSWRNIVNRCAKAVDSNQGLLYHRNVRVIDLYIARQILEWSGATISFIVLSSTFYFMGLMEAPDDLLLMVAGWVLLGWFCSCVGFMIAALTEYSEAVERIWHTVTYLALPLTGAFSLVDWLPAHLQSMILWVPMVHATEMIRSGYFGNTIRAHYDISYLVLSNLCLMLPALYMVRDAAMRREST